MSQMDNSGETTITESTMAENFDPIIEQPKIDEPYIRPIVKWHKFPNEVKLIIKGKEDIILTVGDFITYEERNGSGAIIVKFCGDKEEAGPIGMVYLPWRDDPDRENGRWASRQFSLRGDPRFIICYPCGVHHYGQHIEWETIKNINDMAPMSNSSFQSKFRSLRNPESEQE